MARDFAFQDAKEPLTIHVKQSDIDGATPGSSHNCVMARALRREHNCFDIQLFRTVAYVRKRENAIPLRYQITEGAKDVLISFDASGRSHPITVTFVPPRWGISAKRNRDPKVVKKRKESHRKRYKELHVEGGKGRRRAYTKPDPLTLMGVRNGTGGRPPGKARME